LSTPDDSIGPEDRHDDCLCDELACHTRLEVRLGHDAALTYGPEHRVLGKVTQTWVTKDGMYIEASLLPGAKDRIDRELAALDLAYDGIRSEGDDLATEQEGVGREGADLRYEEERLGRELTHRYGRYYRVRIETA